MDRAQAAMTGGRVKGCRRALPGIALMLAAGLPGPLLSQTPAPSSTPQSSTAAAPLSIAVPGAPKAAGEPGDDSADTPRATLHVYTNLMQVPVLILDSEHGRLRPIPESKFRVSLDSGPPFKPTHVRREGDDPIQLAILIDTSRPDNELLPVISAAMAALAPGALHSWDNVSVYAMDCGLIRTALDLPADPAKISDAIDRAMKGWSERRHQKHPAKCVSSVQLFDAMTFVTNDLMTLPGRRAMLVLSDGIDRGSRINWNRLARFEQLTSTSVFGLQSRRQREDNNLGPLDRQRNPLAGGIDHVYARTEDQFDITCQSSGGVEFALSDGGLKKGLVHFVDMLRERYIIEYPRSNTATAGMHDLLVTVADPYAYVRPAGISVPLADKKLLANPLTIP